MIKLDEKLCNAGSVAITGHVRPDGDCVGSVLGVYNYIADNYPDIKADAYLEEPGEQFAYMANIDKVKTRYDGNEKYDLFIVCDCGDKGRFEPFEKLCDNSGKIICIDHHVGTTGFFDEGYIIEDYSSACELVFNTMKQECISAATAACLYTGIVTDTGSFKYQSATKRTHEVAGILMEKGINHTYIMDTCSSTRSLAQNRIIGEALICASLICEGLGVMSYITAEQMNKAGIVSRDMGVVIDQLRTTAGTEAAVFMYELSADEWKVSLRSKEYIDVSLICRKYGGGGHVKAAGCTITGNIEDVKKAICDELTIQFKEKNKNV